jgi:hypothetical protein
VAFGRRCSTGLLSPGGGGLLAGRGSRPACPDHQKRSDSWWDSAIWHRDCQRRRSAPCDDARYFTRRIDLGCHHAPGDRTVLPGSVMAGRLGHPAQDHDPVLWRIPRCQPRPLQQGDSRNRPRLKHCRSSRRPMIRAYRLYNRPDNDSHVTVGSVCTDAFVNATSSISRKRRRTPTTTGINPTPQYVLTLSGVLDASPRRGTHRTGRYRP